MTRRTASMRTSRERPSAVLKAAKTRLVSSKRANRAGRAEQEEDIVPRRVAREPDLHHVRGRGGAQEGRGVAPTPAAKKPQRPSTPNTTGGAPRPMAANE
jgi:hypothetical protein